MSDFYSLPEHAQLEALKQLAQGCLPHWFSEPCELAALKYRENAVFAVKRGDGSRYVMRVHRANYHTDAELRSELCWMRFLSETGIDAPAVVDPAGENMPFVVATYEPVPERRQVDVLTWLSGAALGSIEHGMDGDHPGIVNLSRQIGRLASRIHTTSSRWSRPWYFTRHAWDEEGLIGEAPIWGRFWELPGLSADQKQLLLRCRRQAHAVLKQLGKRTDAYGLIHADLVPENMLIEAKQLKVIDFDDCGFGWYGFELATCLYFHQDYSYYEQMKQRLIAGYCEAAGVDAEAIRNTLPLFLMLRSMSYLGWIMTRQHTQAAQELSPMFRERTFRLCEEFLTGPARIPRGDGSIVQTDDC